MSCKEVEREEERGIHVSCILDVMATSSSGVCSRFIKLIWLGVWSVSGDMWCGPVAYRQYTSLLDNDEETSASGMFILLAYSSYCCYCLSNLSTSTNI